MKEYKYSKLFSREDLLIIRNPDAKDDSLGCSSYVDGKCLDKPGKYCDGCASEFLSEHC